MTKEWVLNIANGRWGLTKRNRVGPVSAWIRECSPKNVPEWEEFYLKKLEKFLMEKGIPLGANEYLEDLGKRLYIKIAEVLRAEIDEVTQEDCVKYIRTLVIDRTFQGYVNEKRTVFEKLQIELGVKILPAPDEWDRLYNVDFCIKVNDKYIGLQIKPLTFEHAPQFASKWKDIYKDSHQEFEKKFGGKVFIVFSVERDGEKLIYNESVIDDIKSEIKRLSQMNYK